MTDVVIAVEPLDAETASQRCSLFAVDAAGTVHWSHWTSIMDRCFGGGVGGGSGPGTVVDAAGIVHLWLNWGDRDSRVVLLPTPEGFDDFGSLPTEYDTVGRFLLSDMYDVDGDGVAEIIQGWDCGGTGCETLGYWTFRFDGTDYATDLCVRADIDFAAIRQGLSTDTAELGRIPPGTCGVRATARDSNGGDEWWQVTFGTTSGWSHVSLFAPPPEDKPAPFDVAGPAPTPPSPVDPAGSIGPSVTEPVTDDSSCADEVASVPNGPIAAGTATVNDVHCLPGGFAVTCAPGPSPCDAGLYAFRDWENAWTFYEMLGSSFCDDYLIERWGVSEDAVVALVALLGPSTC